MSKKSRILNAPFPDSVDFAPPGGIYYRSLVTEGDMVRVTFLPGPPKVTFTKPEEPNPLPDGFLDALPVELLGVILSHLDEPSLLAASRVCRKWRDLTKQRYQVRSGSPSVMSIWEYQFSYDHGSLVP